METVRSCKLLSDKCSVMRLWIINWISCNLQLLLANTQYPLTIRSRNESHKHFQEIPVFQESSLGLSIGRHRSFRSKFTVKIWRFSTRGVSTDSSVGVATRYGLDGLVFESLRTWNSPHLSRPALRPCTMGTGSLSRGKAGGAWCWPPTPCSPEVKERVKLYFYSSSKPSRRVIGWPSPLPPVATVSIR